MSPLKHSKNVAARMGRWSARHRKTAIFGWLAFVVAAFAIGMAVPMQNDRRGRLERRRGPQGRPHHPRRRVRARPAVRVRARPVRDEDRRRRRLPRGRSADAVVDARRLRRGHEAPLAARGRQRGSDLEGPPLGADPVQPEGLLRRGCRLHRLDHGRDREGRRAGTPTTTSARPARPRRARRSTSSSRASSPWRACSRSRSRWGSSCSCSARSSARRSRSCSG